MILNLCVAKLVVCNTANLTGQFTELLIVDIINNGVIRMTSIITFLSRRRQCRYKVWE